MIVCAIENVGECFGEKVETMMDDEEGRRRRRSEVGMLLSGCRKKKKTQGRSCL